MFSITILITISHSFVYFIEFKLLEHQFIENNRKNHKKKIKIFFFKKHKWILHNCPSSVWLILLYFRRFNECQELAIVIGNWQNYQVKHLSLVESIMESRISSFLMEIPKLVFVIYSPIVLQTSCLLLINWFLILSNKIIVIY